jgi:hypothetical protein
VLKGDRPGTYQGADREEENHGVQGTQRRWMQTYWDDLDDTRMDDRMKGSRTGATRRSGATRTLEAVPA